MPSPGADSLQRYLVAGLHRVEGWLDGFSARFIADVMAVQRAAGIAGGFAEIGVHQGKLFLVLRLAAAPGERGVAIDVFGDQHLNADRSGAGDRERFGANLRAWAGTEEGVAVLQRSSLEVAPADILRATGPCRIVSVDGGHTAECTLSDLRLAEAVLGPGGVAVLDDCFNEDWPDVGTGLAYYCSGPGLLRPFAISPNKVYLARPEEHAAYLRALVPMHADNWQKASAMYGCEVRIFRARGGLPPGPKTDAEVVRHALGHPREILRQVVGQPGKAVSRLAGLLMRHG